MMTRNVAVKWKWIVMAVCALFLLCVAAVYAVVASYDYNGLKPEIERAIRDATGKEVTLGGISLKIGLTPALVVRDVSVRNPPWGSRPELAKIGRFEIKVRLLPLLSHRLEVLRLVLVEPDIVVEMDASGRSNLAIDARAKDHAQSKGTGAGGWQISRVTFKELRLEKGRITYIDHESKKRRTVTVAAFTASPAGPLEGPVEIEAKGAYNAESFEAAGTVGPLAALVTSSPAWPINIRISTGGAVLALDGTIDEPLAMRGMKLNFSLKGRDPAGLGRLFGLDPQFKGPFDISGRMTDSGRNAYSISSLKIIQGENDLAGTVKLDLGGSRPMVTAVLSSRKLDLRPHLQEGPDKGKASARPGKVFSAKPLPLEGLGKVDGDIRLRAAEVLLPHVALSHLDTGFVLKEGALDVHSLKAGLGKGSVDGRLALKPQGKAALLTSNMQLHRVDINSLAFLVKAAGSLEGSLDANMDISARGGSIAELMGSLDGKAFFLMGKGRVNNGHINLLGGELSSGLFRLVNPFEKATQYTSVNCFVGSFTVNKGLARATTLVLNTHHMVVLGEGTIDLKAEKLDLSLKPVPKEGIGASFVGKIGLTASELTRPFKLGGTLAQPRLVVDPTQTAITLGKTIGSIALFGPAGIAAALVGKTSDEETSCSSAIAAARKGSGTDRRKGAAGKIQEKSGNALKSVGDKLKSIFH